MQKTSVAQIDEGMHNLMHVSMVIARYSLIKTTSDFGKGYALVYSKFRSSLGSLLAIEAFASFN
jgi:hypothetical protein